MTAEKFLTTIIIREGADAALSLCEGRAVERGTLAYLDLVGPQEHRPPDGVVFIIGHARGERDALRRAAIALSDPRARGVEQDVIRLLADGADVEDALRKASALPEPQSATDAVVIPFRPKA